MVRCRPSAMRRPASVFIMDLSFSSFSVTRHKRGEHGIIVRVWIPTGVVEGHRRIDMSSPTAHVSPVVLRIVGTRTDLKHEERCECTGRTGEVVHGGLLGLGVCILFLGKAFPVLDFGVMKNTIEPPSWRRKEQSMSGESRRCSHPLWGYIASCLIRSDGPWEKAPHAPQRTEGEAASDAYGTDGVQPVSVLHNGELWEHRLVGSRG
jgi:hypothetical protein